MRKHLQTHATFAHIFNELTAYSRGKYLGEMHEDQIASFAALHQSAMPSIQHPASSDPSLSDGTLQHWSKPMNCISLSIT